MGAACRRTVGARRRVASGGPTARTLFDSARLGALLARRHDAIRVAVEADSRRLRGRGGRYRTRTDDLFRVKEARYQLRQSPAASILPQRPGPAVTWFGQAQGIG